MTNLITITNVLGELGTNCYTLANTDTREAFIVDPAARADFLVKQCKDQKLKPVAIFLTHGHFDHIGAVKALRDAFSDIKVYIGKNDEDVLMRPELNLSRMFGISMSETADVLVEDGQDIDILGTKVRCIEVPGHTKGGMCYYVEEAKVLFSGDTLFCQSIGRSDFPTGDGDALIDNITKKLLTLPEDVIVYPGHQSRTTIKREKEMNPYFA